MLNNEQSMMHSSFPSTRKTLDIIHGFIQFPIQIWRFIDKPQFQRLRQIKQLGTLSYTFHSAIHSRFQHSIGTAHLCREFMKHLTQKHKNIYDTQTIIRSAIRTVTLAGLFHDIGHGPFSHMFDNQFMPVLWPQDLQKDKWEHETLSGLIFEKMVRKYGDLKLERGEMDRVVDLISGVSRTGERLWELEIVSNKISGLDVDKFDYLERDSFFLSCHIKTQSLLLINNTYILPAEKGQLHLHFPYRYNEKVNDVYQSRYKLFKHYYLHRVSHAIELMICDALVLIEKEENSFLGIMDTCTNIYRMKNKKYDNMTEQERQKFWGYLEAYQRLNDSILQRITRQKNPSNSPSLTAAQSLITRIINRQLYSLVLQINFQTKDVQIISSTKPKNSIIQSQIIQQQSLLYPNPSDRLLSTDNIRVYNGSINFGCKTADPRDSVFYHENKIHLSKEEQTQMSLNKPVGFNQFYMRVYLTEKVVKQEVRARMVKVFEKVRQKYYGEWKKTFFAKNMGEEKEDED